MPRKHSYTLDVTVLSDTVRGHDKKICKGIDKFLFMV